MYEMHIQLLLYIFVLLFCNRWHRFSSDITSPLCVLQLNYTVHIRKQHENERTNERKRTRNALSLSLSVSCLRTVWECSMFILFSYWFNRRERNASTIDWLTRWRVHICDHILWSVCTHIVYIQYDTNVAHMTPNIRKI